MLVHLNKIPITQVVSNWWILFIFKKLFYTFPDFFWSVFSIFKLTYHAQISMTVWRVSVSSHCNVFIKASIQSKKAVSQTINLCHTTHKSTPCLTNAFLHQNKLLPAVCQVFSANKWLGNEYLLLKNSSAAGLYCSTRSLHSVSVLTSGL